MIEGSPVAIQWHTDQGGGGYDETYDVDEDGDIDIVDVQKVGGISVGKDLSKPRCVYCPSEGRLPGLSERAPAQEEMIVM